MIRRLAAPIAALLLSSLAHAQTEPRPGTVAGLDLSSPQAGAESFIRAWIDKDYFVAYLAMDPELRYQFQNQTWSYNFRAIYGDLPLEGFWDAYVPFVGESQSTVQSVVTVIDTFAEFSGSMRTAEVLGDLPLTFDPAAADELKAEAPDGILARVHIAPPQAAAPSSCANPPAASGASSASKAAPCPASGSMRNPQRKKTTKGAPSASHLAPTTDTAPSPTVTPGLTRGKVPSEPEALSPTLSPSFQRTPEPSTTPPTPHA